MKANKKVKKETTEEKNKTFDSLSKFFMILAGIIIIFSLIAPWLFTKESTCGIIFDEVTGAIGNTIGGIMNPFVALAGICLTFLAFYIQLIANKQQRELFKQELNAQTAQFNKNQFENNFYEMIKLHKENVNEMSITITFVEQDGDKTRERKIKISGREVFKYFINEINILYSIIKEKENGLEPELCIKYSYEIFLKGFDSIKQVFAEEYDTGTINRLYDGIRSVKNIYMSNPVEFNESMKRKGINARYYNCELFPGYSQIISHYYRHLFLIAQFVSSQEESVVASIEKGKYFDLLRTQLSDWEQVMLFYYWKSGNEINWENEYNHFFTSCRLLYNLKNELILKDFDLSLIFELEKNGNEDVFEFQSKKTLKKINNL